jgi:hypothetical protein
MAAALPFIAIAVVASGGGGWLVLDVHRAQQRQVGAAQARALEMEASVARRQAGMEEEALRRDTQRQFGELRAAGGQAGLLDSVTFGDVYKQAATAAELDALSLAYQGETQARGLLTEARITRAARPSWTQIASYSPTSAGMGGYAGGGWYAAEGRSAKSSQLTGVQVTGRRVPTTMTTAPSRRVGPR